MKIERAKLKKNSSDIVSTQTSENYIDATVFGVVVTVKRFNTTHSCLLQPPDCKALIDKIKACPSREELLQELKLVKTWAFGKVRKKSS